MKRNGGPQGDGTQVYHKASSPKDKGNAQIINHHRGDLAHPDSAFHRAQASRRLPA
jgi:hypothetical protein